MYLRIKNISLVNARINKLRGRDKKAKNLPENRKEDTINLFAFQNKI